MPRAGLSKTPHRHGGGREPGIAGTPAGATTRPDGTVNGTPRRWLRLEGAVLLAGALIAYPATGQPWWLVPLIILLPDLLMAGYLGGTRLGAQLYNIAHSTLAPAVTTGLGWWEGKPFVIALGLIWLAHVGLDRLLGYGLKYDDHFQHTHLGHLGPPSDRMRIPKGPGLVLQRRLVTSGPAGVVGFAGAGLPVASPA